MNADTTQKILIEEIIRIVELTALEKAEDIAQMAHIGQRRKGEKKKPYIIHPKRVQLLAKSFGYGLDIQVIAILHDVIEDAENPEYYENLIKLKFGADVYSTVKLLSHDKNIPYDVYLKKLAASQFVITKRAFKVKMLDMVDNLTDVPSTKQKEKYKNAIQMLIDEDLAFDVPDKIYQLLGIEKSLTEAPKEAPAKKPAKPEPEPAPEPKETPEPTDVPEPKGAENVPEPKGAEDASEPEGDMGEPTDAEAPGDEPPMPGGGGEGGDIFGDDPADGEDAPADEESPENSIVQFNDKLKQSKIIAQQKTEVEPGFDFSNDNEFYRENYIALTNNGSVLIGVPNAIQNNADKDFIKKSILPKIIKVAYEAIKNGKDVVLLGDYGLPYYNGKYSNSTSGIIAKVLNDKFKNTILFDTWNPQDYYGFVSNTNVWKELKQRTEADNMKIKSALYLFLLATNRDKKVLKKLKTNKVLEVLSKWGLSQNNIEIETHEDEIYRVIFPDRYSSPETEASHIIKTYLQLLRVDMLKKVIQYEKEGKTVIVPTDINTSWVLNNSFKDLDKLQQFKKEKVEEPEEPAEEPGAEKPEKEAPEDKTKEPAEEPEKPEETPTEKQRK